MLKLFFLSYCHSGNIWLPFTNAWCLNIVQFSFMYFFIHLFIQQVVIEPFLRISHSHSSKI